MTFTELLPTRHRKTHTFERGPLQDGIPITVQRLMDAPPEGGSGKLRPSDTLGRRKIIKAMVGQMEAAVAADGSVWRIRKEETSTGFQRVMTEPEGRDVVLYKTPTPHEQTYFNNEKLSEIVGGIIDPVGGWGKKALLIMHFDTEHPMFPDIPVKTLAKYQRLQARFIREFMLRKDENGEEHPTGSAHYGMVVAPATIYAPGSREEKKAPSGQTVLAVHGQVVGDSDLDGYSNKDVAARRDAEVWDGGISRTMGEHLIAELGGRAQIFWPDAQVTADPMGARIALPDFTPEHFGTMDFVNGLWKPLFSAAQRQVEEVHRIIHKKGWDEALKVVQEERLKGDIEKFNMRRYRKALRPTTERRARRRSSYDNETIRKMYEMQRSDELRLTSGLSLGARFNSGEPTILVATFGNGKYNFGGDEGFCIDLERPSEPLPKDEAARIVEENGRVVDRVLAAV